MYIHVSRHYTKELIKKDFDSNIFARIFIYRDFFLIDKQAQIISKSYIKVFNHLSNYTSYQKKVILDEILFFARISFHFFRYGRRYKGIKNPMVSIHYTKI
jgi:hypothetical protein